jgi:hypothetical protein
VQNLARSTPVILPGAAAEIGELWVDKLLDQWLGALAGEASDVLQRLGEFMAENRIGGCPKSQAKWKQRLNKRFGERLLSVKLKTGSRAHYEYKIDLLCVTGAFRSIAEDKRLMDEGIAERPTWLTGLRVTASKDGAGRSADVRIRFICGVSKHALRRLIQRGGCCTVSDLHAAMRAAWPVLSAVEAATAERRKERNADTWLVPVKLPTMTEPVVFVMSGPSAGDDEILCFVRTVYPLSFLKKYEQNRVLRLHALLTEASFDLFALVESHRAEYVSLLEALRTSEERRFPRA